VDAESVDCFTLSWLNEFNWIFPPFGLVSKVLEHLKTSRAHGIVIFSKWTARSWWPIVRSDAHQYMILPHQQDLMIHSVFSNYGFCNFDLLACFFDYRTE
jgi:hypothetical protein